MVKSDPTFGAAPAVRRTLDVVYDVLLGVILISNVASILAMTSVSAWVVFHDAVWQTMKSEGAISVWMICEAFNQLRHCGIVPATIAATLGVVFIRIARKRRTKGDGGSVSANTTHANQSPFEAE